MSITGTMYRGLSGLNASSSSIEVTGDNIANVNTIGHRASRAQFEDVLNRSIMGVGELGGGVRMAKIEKLFNQGSIVDSPRSTDMAINGRGFFVVRGNNNGVDGTYYTRAGQFNINEDGYLANQQNLRVQGYMADPNGVISTQLTDMQLDQSIPPNMTTDIGMTISFDGNTSVPASLPFDINDMADTTTFEQSTTIYDSAGAGHQVSIHFTRTADDTWTWNAVANGAELNPPVAGPVVIDSGGITFDPATNNIATTTGGSTPINFLGATAGQVVAFDFTGSTETTRSRIGSTTNESDVIGVSNNGYAGGSFIDVGLEPDGTIIGRYDNGRSLTIGRMALADFRNQNGLESVGGTMFGTTAQSGDALIGNAGSGGRGMISGNALEQSNVDLSNEFVRLITDQRAYQATSKIVTTADELLVETVNLKR
jgi:flagellar hook protein FlgE